MSHHPEYTEAQEEMTQRDRNESIIEQAIIENGVSFPVDTNAVLSLMVLCQYRCDRLAIEKLFRQKRLTKPAKIGSRLKWDQDRVLILADCLEVDRAWIPDSPLHDSKKLDHELTRDKETSLDVARKMKRWLTSDIHVVIADMVNEPDHAVRQVISGLLIHRLNIHD